jgi:hypothetical protein
MGAVKGLEEGLLAPTLLQIFLVLLNVYSSFVPFHNQSIPASRLLLKRECGVA